MPIRPSKNVSQKMIEFPPELAAEVEAFAAGRDQSFRSVVLRALRRHLDNPPPLPPADPPLPDAPPDPPAEKPAAGKKSRGRPKT